MLSRILLSLCVFECVAVTEGCAWVSTPDATDGGTSVGDDDTEPVVPPGLPVHPDAPSGDIGAGTVHNGGAGSHHRRATAAHR